MIDKFSIEEAVRFAKRYCMDVSGFDLDKFEREVTEIRQRQKNHHNYYDRENIIEWDKLFDGWYRSLELGKPDYSVYSSIDYLPEMWACWAYCSRIYINSLFYRKHNNVPIYKEFGNVKSILDVGNGIGCSTAALKEMFPKSKVYGNNIRDSYQWNICDKLSKDYKFTMKEDLSDIGEVDILFASEYFEHFIDPITHVKELINIVHPKYMIIASAFGTISLGHFNEYILGDSIVSPQTVSREFNKFLKFNGYEKLKTTCWNSRPNIWRLKHGENKRQIKFIKN